VYGNSRPVRHNSGNGSLFREILNDLGDDDFRCCFLIIIRRLYRDSPDLKAIILIIYSGRLILVSALRDDGIFVK
jgi:hypothetical protein